LELDAVVELDDVDAVEQAEEVEVPPRAAELAVGRELEAGVGLLLHEIDDRGVFDGAEAFGVELAGVVSGARLGDGGGTEEAADDVGAVGGSNTHPVSLTMTDAAAEASVTLRHPAWARDRSRGAKTTSVTGVRVVRCLLP